MNSENNTANNNNNCTIYAWVHIPRTGGSSAHNRYMNPLIQQQNNNKNIMFYPIDGRKVGTRLPANDFNSPGCSNHTNEEMNQFPPYGGTHCSGSEIYDCLTNNYYYNSNPHRRQQPKQPNVKLLTRIRHPVNRIISEYNWFGKNNNRVPPPLWTPSMVDKHKLATRRTTTKDNNKSYNFTDWILDDDNIAHNRQALYFILNEPYPINDNDCIVFNKTKTVDYYQTKFGGSNGSSSTGTMLEKFNSMTLPENVLDKYMFVGILEDELLSDDKFKRTFHVDPVVNKQKIHASSKGGKIVTIDEQTRNLILERNKLDMQLYTKVQNFLKE